jgi:pSer/pThr/pTyr-binding forkhead associated (FHA) protein
VGRIIAKALFCGAAGLLAWVLTAPFFPSVVGDPRWGAIESLFIFLTVAFVSVTAGVMQGLQQGGKRNIFLGSVISLFFGTVAGMMGYGMAGGIANGLFGSDVFLKVGLSPDTIVARTLVGLIWGAFLGAGVGAGLRSTRGIISGAVGGAVGGGVAGVLFDPIGYALGPTIMAGSQGVAQEVGTVSRAVLASTLGFAVGLFTALFEYWSRSAWLRLVLGRNEGKEWPLDFATNTIGRDERATIPLFADPNLPPLAALIVKQGGQYVLQDPGSPIGVGLNGMRVPGGVLNPGDTIQVGSLQLQFLMKSGSAQKMMEARSKGVPVGAPAAPLTPIQQPSAPAYPSATTQAVPVPSAPAPSTPALPSLVVLSGPLAGQRFPVNSPLEIGREGSGVALPFDSMASRRHALVSAGPSGLSVQDNGSTNGTYVNGARVPSAFLKQGDHLRIGSTEFRVE